MRLVLDQDRPDPFGALGDRGNPSACFSTEALGVIVTDKSD